MPNPLRTPTIVFDVAFSNQLDQQVQYREALLAKKVAYLAAGWTVDRSSNTITADGNDNWNTAADIVIDTAGNGSWIAMSSPSGAAGGDTLSVVLYANNASADATPQTFGEREATAPYTGGTTSTLPTTAGIETVINTSGDDIIPWSAVLPGRYTAWSTPEGSVFFGVKEEGDPGWGYFMMNPLFSDTPTTGGGGRGGYRFALYTRSGVGAALSASQLSLNQNWETLAPGGGFGNVPAEAQSSIWGISAWTNGLDFAGQGVDDTINVYTDAAAASGGRWIGQLIDWLSLPSNAPLGLLDDSETLQTYRKVCLGGGVWAYAPTASLPFS